MQRIYEVDPPTKEKPGEVLLQHGLAVEALPFVKAEFDENDFRCWSNLAACHRIIGNLNKAKEACKRALALNKYAEKAWYELALIMEDFGEFEHAREAINIAYKILPVNKDIGYRYAMMNMRFGDWQKFWDAWEFSREYMCWRPFSGIPKWYGEPLEGKRLLILHEGGYGDFFWLIRYLGVLKEKGCQITYVSWKKQRTFSEQLCPWIDRVLSAEDFVDEKEYDFQIPLWSLLALHDGPLPMREPYIVAPKISLDKTAFTVGLCWEAEELGQARKFRSIPINALRPLADLKNIQWIGLTLTKKVPSWCSDCRTLMLEGWEKTASLIERCDLVIAVDTAIAHLAGGMGKETWICLPKNRDWKWGTREVPFQWYSEARYFTNPGLLKWDGLVSQLVCEIGRTVKEIAGENVCA